MAEVPMNGRLLVATPALGDPNFARAVVLVLDHDAEGTLGVVINRPTTVSVDEVLPPWSAYAAAPNVVFQGGPVGVDSALALGRVPDEAEPLGWRRVAGPVGLVDLDAPPEVLAAELSGFRIFAGYAGWGPGQLQGELEQGAWYVVAAEAGDPFSSQPEQLWRAVLRRQRSELAFVATFPDDPTMN